MIQTQENYKKPQIWDILENSYSKIRFMVNGL